MFATWCYYAAALRVTFRLITWDVDKDTGSKTIKDIKEQEVYMGDTFND